MTITVCPKTGRVCELTGCSGCWKDSERSYTKAELDAAVNAAIEATKEKAAKVIDSLYKHDRKESGYDEGWNDALDIAEQAIRSMK